jgi:leucyl aminopeptidase
VLGLLDGGDCRDVLTSLDFHRRVLVTSSTTVNERDRNRPLADRRRHALDVAAADVANSEDAGGSSRAVRVGG